MSRKIDAYTHLSPPGFLDFLEGVSGGPHVFRKLFSNTPTLVDTDRRLRQMDRYGIESNVVVPLPWLEGLRGVQDDPSLSVKAARLCNDGLHAVARAHPGRLHGVALLPSAAGPRELVSELERAVEELGLLGGVLFVGPTVKPPDHPDYEPLYQKAEQLDVPLWLHPCRPGSHADYPEEKFSKYLIWQTLGWVSDSSVAMARLVFSGVFQRYPDLKLITHHHGALIPTFAKRMQACYESFEQCSGVDLQTPIEQPYIEHFKKFYCDTASLGFEPATIQLACDFFGVERVLFGSDSPMDSRSGEIFTPETDRTVAALKLTEAERQDIYGGNMTRLLSRERVKKRLAARS
ncbi:MAG TPA: amidohydrolase family protein [Archangium sp.]|uniref:amidohydrolase family protein n=1 Tax=Archangium sp. TaxID=1872627 RepID=UPI002E30F2D3|nr:amidohydrolase family protein [Archangium sp.]HEX5749633.1 amidohydrolase family protein [Archangium sp.]